MKDVRGFNRKLNHWSILYTSMVKYYQLEIFTFTKNLISYFIWGLCILQTFTCRTVNIVCLMGCRL